MSEKYEYAISGVTEDGWITIDTTAAGGGPTKVLAERYAKSIGKALWKPYVDDEQYVVQKDPYRLTFQYDDMFGCVVILNKMEDKEKVIEILKQLF